MLRNLPQNAPSLLTKQLSLRLSTMASSTALMLALEQCENLLLLSRSPLVAGKKFKIRIHIKSYHHRTVNIPSNSQFQKFLLGFPRVLQILP